MICGYIWNKNKKNQIHDVSNIQFTNLLNIDKKLLLSG